MDLIFPFIILLGFCFGSYLHLVIDRLPKMLGIAPLHADYTESRFNLAWPGSHCTECGTRLRFYDLIPVVSFVQLLGRCRYCKSTISWSYPLIEICTAALFLTAYLLWGLSLTGCLAVILLCGLLVLGILDYRYHLLPDTLTLTLLWIGLLANTQQIFAYLPDAVIGAVIGYLSLWLVYWVHKSITKRVGIGHGDFKLLALLGAWLGWTALPAIVVFASALGLCYALVLYVCQRLNRETPLPLGTFLAISGGGWLLAGAF